MIYTLIALAVVCSACALILLYWKVLELTFPEKLGTDEIYKLSTEDLWKLRVCRYRKGRTNGQPVLLVHGANVNQHTFTTPKGSNLVEYLVERGFDCWTVDLRGCRSSEAPFERHRNQITVDDHLNYDIPAVIRLVQQETGYAKIHYCGQSLGGMLLYAYALKFGTASIASAVTLGSPLGFEGVKVHRSPWLVGLIGMAPSLTGEIARGLIPFALLFRSSPVAFPMNMRNIARGMSTGSFYNMLEDPLPGVLRDLVKWINTHGWRMDHGNLDMLEGLKTLDLPLFAIFAPLDPFVPLDKAKAFFDALPSEDKRILIASRELGCKRDYNHCDLAFGLEGPREIFGPVARWFDTHSSREQITRIEPVSVSGYQAPLRPSERADILSGGSFAHVATPTVVPSPVSLRAETPVPKAPPVVETPVARKSEPAPKSAEQTAPGKSSVKKPVAKKPATAKPKSKSPAVEKPIKKPAAKAPATKKPEAKKPAAKKPVAKKPVAKKPAVKKAAAAESTPAAAQPSTPVVKSPANRTSPKGPDLASVSAALSALRPTSPQAASKAAAPIRVKQKSKATPALAKDASVETPESVLKALSNASSAMEAFKKPGKKPQK